MWLRTALFLILGLVLYRFLGGLLRALSSQPEPGPSVRGRAGDGGQFSRDGTARADGGSARPGDAGTPWPPGDVIDVPFRDRPPTQ